MKSILFVLPTLLFPIVSNANGVFNGPVTEGSAVPSESGREISFNSFYNANLECAAIQFVDVYRQVYPQFTGEVGLVSTSQTDWNKYDISQLPFKDTDGVKRIYVSKFVSPRGSLEEIAAAGGAGLGGLLFAANGTPGQLAVQEFEVYPRVLLVSKIPGLKFNVEERIDSYDSLGQPVGKRFVITDLSLVAGEEFGTRVPFTNRRTGKPTVITWNTEEYTACLASVIRK